MRAAHSVSLGSKLPGGSVVNLPPPGEGEGEFAVDVAVEGEFAVEVEFAVAVEVAVEFAVEVEVEFAIEVDFCTGILICMPPVPEVRDNGVFVRDVGVDAVSVAKDPLQPLRRAMSIRK
jgi:hypothetical protein